MGRVVARDERGQFAERDVCVNGHSRTPDNIYVEPGTGKRKCLTCKRQKPSSLQKRTPTQESYRAMKMRCDGGPSSKHWKYYGARGITICDRWLGKDGFKNFVADMGERPEGRTLDRIDNDGHYERGNCRWATPKEQVANRRGRYGSSTLTLAIVIALVALAVPAVAGAHVDRSITHAGAAATYGYDIGHTHTAHRPHHPHAKRTPNARKAHATSPTTPTASPTQNPTPNPTTPATYNEPTNTGVQYVEGDDQDCTAQTVVPFLQAHGAAVLRMVLTPAHAAAQDGLACIQAARAAGYKIYLTLAYDSASSPAQVAAYVTSTLATYGPAFAVALGNEQTLANGWLNEASSTPAMYYAMWQSVESTLAADDPTAIRVLADASPWDVSWLEQLVKLHPAGAQAAAFHCYNSYFNGLQDVPQLAATIASDGLPLWCSEMAPATNPSPDSPAATTFITQTVGQFDTKVSQTLAASPDVELRSYYSWPEIGA